ncbi:hypothetical protein HG530_010877 [Fusarium avenaceum]|nr:hypothetical protein HG530_010877 [Fusarium avenaceum]
MNRSTEGPMEWEFKGPGTFDPNSPFAWQRQKNEKSAFRPNPYANFGTPFRNPSFTTPWPRAVHEGAVSEVASDDENLESINRGITSSNDAARVKRKPKSHSRPPTYPSRNPAFSTKRRKRVTKPSRGFSHVDVGSYSTESSSAESIDISDSQRPGNRSTREATSFISAQEALRSTKESGWTPLTLSTLVILTAICVGGTFYYRVLSVSILVVWIYYTVMFSENYVLSSGKEESRHLRKPFRIWVLDFIKVAGLIVLILWCLIISPIHIFIPTPMDAWTRYAEHPTFRSFEVLNDPGRSTIVEIFAIHGLGSNPSSAWRYGGNGSQVHWLTDLLPKQKGLENIKIIMLNHQTRWDSHSPEVDFDVFAKMMLDDIEHLHQV